jgi:ATP-dependent exoDNAse (exonuclease V) beta subunit
MSPRAAAPREEGTSAALADAAARALIRSSLDETLVVEAAAGTGKTTELVQRITAVLASGAARVDSIAAVTFTEKAAGELKLRLRGAIERARRGAEGPARAHLEHALAHLEEARIGTIHAFCADLLRERPVEARLDPAFVTMTEPEAERLHAEAFDGWLEARLEDPPEGLRRSLRRRGDRGEGASERLRRAAYQLAGFRDFPAPWRREPWDREGEIAGISADLRVFCDRLERGHRPSDGFFVDLAKVRALDARLRAAGDAGVFDPDEVEAELVALARDRDAARPRKGQRAPYGKGVDRHDLLAEHARLFERLARFAASADASLAALLQVELAEVTARYEAAKARTGRLDFVDLLVRARDLLRDSDEVRVAFQRRFRRLFIDEFQDTDPLQAEILLLLAASDPSVRDARDAVPEPGKLFLVGDPKQAIYRFRRADLAVYREVVDRVVAAGGRLVHLSTSFRSVPELQAFVNAAFAPRMREDAVSLQAGYVALEPARAGSAAQPSIVALPVPEPYGARGLAQYAVTSSLPGAVAAFVAWLVHESGWTVTERGRPDERVPVAARHVCLLFRRFEAFGADVTRPYVAGLEAHGVPHVLVGGKSFHDREEVETMTAALSAIEWPDDELSVFATLKGSLFAISDEALLEYKFRFSSLHPLRDPGEALDEVLAPVGEALAMLRDLHRQRNHRPVADTLSALLEATRAHAAFALRPSGPQALANVLHLAELGRQYEASESLSFRGFVERLREEAGARSSPEAPILEEGSDGVRLMTVHKAKGLELPVVIVADLTAKLSQGGASRYVDPARGLCAMRLAGLTPWELVDHEGVEARRDEAEGVRLAYVAATRARDVLVVPAVGDLAIEPGGVEVPFPKAGWLSPLHAALYPRPDERGRPMAAPGCPPFGDDTVLKRPEGGEMPATSMRPGLFGVRPEGSPGYRVVWFDPARLELAKAPVVGVPRQDLLGGRDVPEDVVERDLADYQAWRAERDRALHDAARPALRFATATAHAAAGVTEAGAPPVVLHALPRDEGRPAGPRFGTLVHAVLATVALDADAARVAEAAELEGRILGAPADEIAAAAVAAARALAHPLMERAREAARRGECRRETPVVLATGERELVEGVVDLAFREALGWTVVDFKTDRVEGDELAVYERQVSLYARAIAEATGEPARAALLQV